MRPAPPRIKRILVVVLGLLVMASISAAGFSRSGGAAGDRSTAASGAAGDPASSPLRSRAGQEGQQSQVAAAASRIERRTGKKPNIILVSTDDETTTDMRWMPKTVKALGRHGVTFSRALSPHPLCCPARAAILTGQYAQNNGVKTNQSPFDYEALQSDTALPVWMHRAGYRTAFTGKYLNGYGVDGKPEPGWDYWDATMAHQYSYVGYTMYQDGRQEKYAKLNNVDYINRRILTLVKKWSSGPKPFFIWASHVAPHGRIDNSRGITPSAKPLPPKRFANLFNQVPSPSLRDPGYLDTDVSDHNYLARSKPVPSHEKINTIFRQRIRSLQGVDEGVAQLVRTLKRLHQLDNTYIFFVSDNGFLLGEHRLITKNVPYRQSIRVPLLVRGPGVPQNTVRDQRALMIDLAPTFAEIAGARPLVTVDGTSLLPALQDDAPLRDTVLIQAGPQTARDLPFGWWWRGVTTDRYTYSRYFSRDFEELYDHAYDPSEVENVADDPAYADVLAELRDRTQQLVTCSSVEQCSATFGPVPEPAR